MEAIHTENYRNHTIKIFRDDSSDNPGDWGDDELFLVANHRDFFVTRPELGRSFTARDVIREYEHTHFLFPLEAYIHGGVCLALAGEGNFPDRAYDVSMVGLVAVSKAILSEMTRKKARKYAERLLKTWNDYLLGNVYGYVIEPAHETQQDPCTECV